MNEQMTFALTAYENEQIILTTLLHRWFLLLTVAYCAAVLHGTVSYLGVKHPNSSRCPGISTINGW